MNDHDREVVQLHFGGGTPTFHDDAQLKSLMEQLGRHFALSRDDTREFSIEVDPRTVGVERLAALAGMGFNRISLGIQDINPEVQKAVNRVQDTKATLEMIDASLTAREMVELCLQSAHTRLPIFSDDPENIVGVIHAKDLLRAVHRTIEGDARGWGALADLDVTQVAMEAWFVPDATSLDDQMPLIAEDGETLFAGGTATSLAEGTNEPIRRRCHRGGCGNPRAHAAGDRPARNHPRPGDRIDHRPQ